MIHHAKVPLERSDLEVINDDLFVALPDDRVILLPLEELISFAESSGFVSVIPDPDRHTNTTD